MRGPLIAGALLTVLSGCGGGTEASSSSTPSEEKVAAPEGLVCADEATPVDPPPDLPAVIPLPEGTVITSAEERSGRRLVIDGVAPDDFRTTLTFFQDSYAEAGLELTGGEVEERDAESDFAGAGYRGRWKVTDIAECGDTRIELVVAPG
ncbi:MAG: hypothetical protein H0T85_11980 [Geodermatophilaceae bacterium]|nr:hypothetical protein [Geodermatophilaceae bacterium]